LEKAMAIKPDFVPPLSQLVELDIVENSHSAALERIRAAMQKSPKAAELPFFDAKVYLAQKQPGEAEKALRRSLELDPNYRDAYIALAQISIQGGKIDVALNELDKTLEKTPKDVGALTMKAVLHDGRGDFDKARETYEKLLSLTPSPPWRSITSPIFTRSGCSGPKGAGTARQARNSIRTASLCRHTGLILYLNKKPSAGLAPGVRQSAAQRAGGAVSPGHGILRDGARRTRASGFSNGGSRR
jgi:tetratricopeptide (TPR) repeat protein